MEALLLSGGMDSIALAYWKRPAIAFTIDYGQLPAPAEIRAAAKVASELGMRHEVLRVDCRSIGSGDLAGTEPLGAASSSEWWPYRNQLIVTLAATRAIALGVKGLLIATVSSDGTHADGRREFVDAMSHLLGLQEGALRLSAPAIELTTAQLARQSKVPISLLAWAHSCYSGPLACGHCGGCYKHRKSMCELGYETY